MATHEPHRQPRENAVPCSKCKRMTWNYYPVCDMCKERDDSDE